jgi:hypothetical protein
MSIILPTITNRRNYIKGLTLGAGAIILQPFLDSLASQANGEKSPPSYNIFY